MRICVFIILTFCWFAACQPEEELPRASATADEKYAGGVNGTAFDFSENAFGVQVKGLTAEQEGFFVTGNAFFRTNWVTAGNCRTKLFLACARKQKCG